MALLGRLQVDLIANAQQFRREIASVSESMTQVGRNMTHFGARMTAGLTVPLAAAGAAAFKLASDAEESANKFNVVMGDAADDVRMRLEDLTATVPLTRAQMEQMSAGIQDMLVPMGLARDEAAHMSADYVQLAADLGSFNNVGTEQVLMDIQSALAGSSEPMRKYGVDTRVSRLEAIALTEGIIEQGQELDNTTTALAVMAAIQADSKDAMGDAARTVDSAANSYRFLMRDLRNLAEVIGRELIPMITPVIQKLTEWIGKAGELDPRIVRVGVVVGGLVAAVGPLLVALGSMISAIGTIMGVLAPLGGALAALATGPVGIIVAALAGLVAGGVAVVRNWDWIKEQAQAMGRAVSNYVGQMVDMVVGYFTNLRDRALGLVGGMVDGVTGFFGRMADVIVGNSIVPDMVDDVLAEFVRMATGMSAETVAAKYRVETALRGLRSSFYTDMDGIQRNVANNMSEVRAEVRRTAEEITASAKTVESALGDMVGGTTGTPGGGGIGGIFSTIAGFFGGENGIAGMLSGILGGGGGGVGGTVGGLLGSALGPIGGVVGGWLGGQLSGLFGGDKKQRAALDQLEAWKDQFTRQLDTAGPGGLDSMGRALTEALSDALSHFHRVGGKKGRKRLREQIAEAFERGGAMAVFDDVVKGHEKLFKEFGDEFEALASQMSQTSEMVGRDIQTIAPPPETFRSFANEQAMEFLRHLAVLPEIAMSTAETARNTGVQFFHGDPAYSSDMLGAEVERQALVSGLRTVPR